MTQYIINSQYGSVFGMDVHARSVSVRGADLKSAEVKRRRFSGPGAAEEVARWMKAYFPAPHYAAYESGCTGFALCRQLISLGIDCDVIAVSSIARSTDDRQRKNDRIDAKRLLSELLAPEPSYSIVWMPDEELESVRDLARARFDAVACQKRSKQQTTALLLRHGYVWDEKTKSGSRKATWTKEFRSWIGNITLGCKAADDALASYMRAIREEEERVRELDGLIRDIAATERFKPYTDALCLLKGIDVASAVLFVAEMGDFDRFKNGRSVSKWLGTVPKESSSGEHVSRGRITKAGNVHCRTALIEGICAMSLFSDAPKQQRKGHEVSSHVASLCAQANRRLLRRHRHLRGEAKIGENKAKVAVANEMVRWIVKIGQAVKGEVSLAAGQM
jgi:transposase